MINLIVGVDLQKDFMNKGGALYVNGSEEIKPNIKKIIRTFINSDYHIWFTLDTHFYGDREISGEPDYINTFPPHCLYDTEGVEVIEEVIKFEDTYKAPVICFEKNKFSVFEGNPRFIEELKKLGYIDNIYIMGCAGDFCVKALIEGLIKYKGDFVNYTNLYIIKDAIASVDDNNFNHFLKSFAVETSYSFINVITTNDLISSIK
jgi:nicotinamidase/pyrazinamidase